MTDTVKWSIPMNPKVFAPEPMFKFMDPSAESEWNSVTGAQAFYRLAYNKESADCSVRALAVACAAPYSEAYKAMTDAGRVDGESASLTMMLFAAMRLGYRMIEFKPHGKTLRTAERILRNSKGGYVLTTCDHAAGIWDGELIDFSRGTLARVRYAFVLIRRKAK